ncbi:MAG: Oligopeptidase A [candidate division TM6 bacterium GW2011_GWF2_32_72]|nr:MAG: Oligopeptidase A [candidate division TM6 bacterium GW2011_GWF2_32_72]
MKYTYLKLTMPVALLTTGLGLSNTLINNKEKEMITQIKNINDLENYFLKTTQEIKTAADQAKETALFELTRIYSIAPEQRTFENTMLAIDNASNKLGTIANAISTAQYVHPEKEMRQTAQEAIEDLQNFSIEHFSNNYKIYTATKEYVENNLKKENLSNERKYFLEETIKDFNRKGFNLPEKERKEIEQLNKEIAKIELDFEANIAKDQSCILVNQEELTGMSEDFISAHQKTNDDKIKLGCDYPTVFGILNNCTNANTRKKMHQNFQNRAYPINLDLLDKLIEKRDLLAEKLGFESYAHLELDSQMVKHPQKIYEFWSALEPKFLAKQTEEIAKIKANLPESVQLTENKKIAPWDIRFLQEQYKKTHFQLDEELLKEYFPLESTIQGMLNVYQQFLDINLKEVSANLWHQDVKLLEISEKQTKKILGYLALDLFPREGKYTHACFCGLIRPTTQGEQLPSAGLIIANFPKPTAQKPALLKYDDVITFFHEFGHAMHGVFGRTELSGCSGTSTTRDFVEMPSQMMEEWMREKEILKLIAKHYVTGDSLPDEIIEKITQLTKFDSGYIMSRQLILGRLSMAYFEKGAKKDTNQIYKNLTQSILAEIEYDSETHMQTSFGHLTNYGSKYYGYMWSKVFALDMFEQIKKEGLLNPEAGKKYIQKVIGLGGSKDPEEMLLDFLGRNPNQEAFEKVMGL